MNPRLTEIITASDAAVRDRSLASICGGASRDELVEHCRELDAFRRSSPNLYHRVRAMLFLAALHEDYLPPLLPRTCGQTIPVEGQRLLLSRRFDEAIDAFRRSANRGGPGEAVCSALAEAYRELAFQTLADQVQSSVRSVRGNQWMFRMAHPADHPLRLRPELPISSSGRFPVLRERTPVRMDFSHAAWSDIFFLGMDDPGSAQVINASINLALHGQGHAPEPPVQALLRVLPEPVLQLVSVDLKARARLVQISEVFDFASDHLGLLKAATIASGLVPAGLEGSRATLRSLLEVVVGKGLGLELISEVRSIPKGSRLAVSTSLLASLIAVLMRATGQIRSLTGGMQEADRRMVAARAILGEWLGGSGGGWQDSGGVWPGIKKIQGVTAREGDPEHGVSRGCLLPRHDVLSGARLAADIGPRLQSSLVLVHGGLAQDVGPILEMVTERYLLRSEPAWQARKEAVQILGDIEAALARGDLRALGQATERNFTGPIQTIIPWASNAYTEQLIEQTRARFGAKFWGFWMLGGMAGGGMGFLFDPEVRREGRDFLAALMRRTRDEMRHALPFAMEPVVYEFALDAEGSRAELRQDSGLPLPAAYYRLLAPRWLRQPASELGAGEQADLRDLARAAGRDREHEGLLQDLVQDLLPSAEAPATGPARLRAHLEALGFDAALHEQVRVDLQAGRIGLAKNRLPAETRVTDVRPGDVVYWKDAATAEARAIGTELLRAGRCAVVTLAAGVGSRWTRGAGVVKALHPFCKMGGRYRSFLEVHLAKSRQSGGKYGIHPLHVITTSYLTGPAIEAFLAARGGFHEPGVVFLSPGQTVGWRLVPTERDLRFAWEELPHKTLDQQAQKVRESLQEALIQWARRTGEGTDYVDNVPEQCLHPVGHWYEVPHLLLGGVLRRMLETRPELRYLLLHNIDTLGAGLDPALLGHHAKSGPMLTFEVIPRRVEDRGGGLARVQDRLRLVEGLALPREEDENRLTYYNSMTTWIDIDALLTCFGLERGDLEDRPRVSAAIRDLGRQLPTYVTLKEVKKRWGHGQEDTFPVAQFEKLWGDMTALPQVASGYVEVARTRGQQLKEQGQLDRFLRDGSLAAVEASCDFGPGPGGGG